MISSTDTLSTQTVPVQDNILISTPLFFLGGFFAVLKSKLIRVQSAVPAGQGLFGKKLFWQSTKFKVTPPPGLSGFTLSIFSMKLIRYFVSRFNFHYQWFLRENRSGDDIKFLFFDCPTPHLIFKPFPYSYNRESVEIY